MLVSKCCHCETITEGTPDFIGDTEICTCYYVCSKCRLACDVIEKENISLEDINKEIKTYRKEKKVKLENVDCILTEKLKDKKFKKLYDKECKKLEESEKNMKDKNFKMILQGLKEAKEGKIEGPYSSVEEMFANMEKNWTIFDYLESYWYRYFWNFVSEIPLKIKSFFQRGYRGWANEDAWDFDGYLSEVITGGIKHLLIYGNSCFSAKDRLNLRKIIQTFETAKKINNTELLYVSSDKFTWKGYKKTKRFYKKINKRHNTKHKVMTLREVKRFERGFLLFREYYFKLWD